MSADYIQSLNIGTGLNTTQIVDAIVDARRVTKESLINKKIEQRQTQVSALGELKKLSCRVQLKFDDLQWCERSQCWC